MTFIAALLASAGVIALSTACLLVAKATAVLRKDVDELKARDRFAAPPVLEGAGRGHRPMMSGLYAERRGQLEWLTGVPAWPGLAAAAMLGLAGSVLGVASGPPARPVSVDRQAEIASLRAAVDSLNHEVRRLGDSLRPAVAGTVAGSGEHATRVARVTTLRVPRRPAADPAAPVIASPVLPPPPSLQEIQAGTATPP
jgi:hypothetical protein